MSWNFYKKGSEVSIKARSTPASLPFKGQVTKSTTEPLTIELHDYGHRIVKDRFLNSECLFKAGI